MIIYSGKIFKNPIRKLIAFSTQEVISAFCEIEKLKNKYYLVGYCRYEMKNIFFNKKYKYDKPLLYFEVFDDFEEVEDVPSCEKEEIEINPIPQLDFHDYQNAIGKIKSEIANGNTYEVNYTMDFKIDYENQPLDLYKSLLNKQKTPYNAYFQNEFDTILSFSPELFFELEGNKIKTKPMKGTIPRGKTREEDLKNIEFLQNDIKNRSENVMIVDLLRNDLGRISKTGSVKVDKLFEIETHKTLHQMTSEISGELKENITLFEIFKSIFPCGSITGAPKISTMKIIEEVEQGNRNIYCGAIGFITPEKSTFSVPIRILQKSNNDKDFTYRAGSAIVWDSDTLDEWNEVFVKTKFLQPDFKLVETMLVQNNEILFKNEHLKRLQKSIKELNFKESEINFPKTKDGILRLLYSKNGEVEFELKELKPNKTNKIIISDKKLDSKNPFLYHKTTFKPWYKDSYEKIRNGEIFDYIFLNEKNEICEGSRSNIVIEKNGDFYTPPISSGRLDGIYLNSMKNLQEKVLTIKDLMEADKIFCVNSVRGCVEVVL